MAALYEIIPQEGGFINLKTAWVSCSKNYINWDRKFLYEGLTFYFSASDLD